jgi:hypothetical protein
MFPSRGFFLLPGGLVRAATAWRHTDGTFMAEAEVEECQRARYERRAAGGRARAAKAPRRADGTFASEHPPGWGVLRDFE